MRYYLLIAVLFCGCLSTKKADKSPDLIIDDNIKALDDIGKDIDSNADSILKASKNISPAEEKKAIQIHAKQIKDIVKKLDDSVKPELNKAVKGTKELEKERDDYKKALDDPVRKRLYNFLYISLFLFPIGIVLWVKFPLYKKWAELIILTSFASAVTFSAWIWFLNHFWIFMIVVGAIISIGVYRFFFHKQEDGKTIFEDMLDGEEKGPAEADPNEG
jgi:hypothetical protein